MKVKRLKAALRLGLSIWRPTRRVLALCWLMHAMTAVALLFAASAARAESFDVAVRVFCPAAWNMALDRLDEDFTTRVDVPCAGIRVVAMDADPLNDEYCGSAYTDSRGVARFRGSCNDTAGGRPEVYLKVEGRSANGFSVGIIDPNPLDRILESLGRIFEVGVPLPLPVIDRLRAHQTFAWLSDERLANEGQQLDFGDVAIGRGFADGSVSDLAARQFWAAQYATQRLRAGTKYVPMDFNYNVAAPIGAPTTLYDTVIVSFNDTAAPSRALAATAHEIGHVLYNTYHSGMLHWLTDAPDYMTGHARCDDDHFQTLAWYEGFADFVRDYVFQRWDWSRSEWVHTQFPYEGCKFKDANPDEPGASRPGLHIEGNVQALLNNIYFGPVRAEQRKDIGVVKQADFVCPVGQRRIVTPIGAVECEREVPAICTNGLYRVDSLGLTDRCLQIVRDGSCRPFQECEPIEQFVNAACSGTAVRRSGPDACLARSPAQHSVPNGAPRPRPDGSPDMVLGRDRNDARAWFSLPSFDQVMEWVIAAGNDSHRAREFWDRHIGPSCLPRNGLRYQYCHPQQSKSFADEANQLVGAPLP
jgi:hypothetical protein